MRAVTAGNRLPARLVHALVALCLLAVATVATRSSAARADTPETAPAWGTWWRPTPGTSWQWQLTTPVDQTVDAEVYDIDLFENPASVVASLHAQGRKVICYMSVGSWEPYRPDAGSFPDSVKGRPIEGWEDERWLDIRQIGVLAPIVAARLDLCKQKGFDGVEPDLADASSNATGFPLTAADQYRYNRIVAALAHARGLAVGLKNDVEQVDDLVDFFDFAVNEECAEYKECSALVPFIREGKAVFHVEYSLSPSEFCAETIPLGFSSMTKHLSLDAWRSPC